MHLQLPASVTQSIDHAIQKYTHGMARCHALACNNMIVTVASSPNKSKHTQGQQGTVQTLQHEVLDLLASKVQS